MKVFETESEMQGWLEKELNDNNNEGLIDLIINNEDIEKYASRNKPESIIKRSFITSLESLNILEIITANSNISNKRNEILKPDILAYCSERETLVIIELKNFPGATREAGTEISAYAAELKTSLYNLSDGDIINVIISPCWPTLIKHHLYNSIVWQNKNIICLEPCIYNGEIKLKIIDIPELVQATLPETFSNEQLAGLTVCLYDDLQQQANPPLTKLHDHIDLMISSMNIISGKGEKLNSHGFAFLSKEEVGFGLSPYFIHVIGIAPFKCLERLLKTENISEYSDLPLASQKYIDIYMDHSPHGYSSSLFNIAMSPYEILKNICSPHIEGLTTWEEINKNIEKNWKPIYFTSWGIFKELSIDVLTDYYKRGVFNIHLNSATLGLDVVKRTIDNNHNYIELLEINTEFFPENYFEDE
ncbi:hypothetical protein [Edwardsiella tarda]|uniref:hypothetical protein n=1 Tax=Edwardsiella tarda TaxID=636 RepID=UPI003B50258B